MPAHKEESLSSHDPDGLWDDDNIGHLSKRAIAPVPIPPFDPFTKVKKAKKKLKKAAAGLLGGVGLLTKPLKKSPKLLKLGVPLAGGLGALGLGGLGASQVLRGTGGGGRAVLPFRAPPPMFRPTAQGQSKCAGGKIKCILLGGAATCSEGFVICFLKVSLACLGSMAAAIQHNSLG